MDTKPILIRPGGGAVAVATALGEPSITVIEGGPAIGVLVADSCTRTGTAAGCSSTGSPGPALTRPSGTPRLRVRVPHPGTASGCRGGRDGPAVPPAEPTAYRVIFIPQSDNEEPMVPARRCRGDLCLRAVPLRRPTRLPPARSAYMTGRPVSSCACFPFGSPLAPPIFP